MLRIGTNSLTNGEFTPVRPAPDEAAMILYTSWIDRKAEGVVLSHEAHLWAVRSRISLPQPDEQRLLVAAPYFHMNALGTSKLAQAAHSTIVLLPQFNARQYVEAISSFRCTDLTSVPTMLALACRERDLIQDLDFSSVRRVRMGSAPVSEALLKEVKAAFPHAQIANVYGTTEAVVWAASQRAARAGRRARLAAPGRGAEARRRGGQGER